MNNFASKELLYREVNLTSPNQRRRSNATRMAASGGSPLI
jgi:hypothetical protein